MVRREEKRRRKVRKWIHLLYIFFFFFTWIIYLKLFSTNNRIHMVHFVLYTLGFGYLSNVIVFIYRAIEEEVNICFSPRHATCIHVFFFNMHITSFICVFKSLIRMAFCEFKENLSMFELVSIFIKTNSLMHKSYLQEFFT